MMYVVAVLCNSMPGQRIKVHWILEEISCMRDMYKTQTKVKFNHKRENHVKRYFNASAKLYILKVILSGYVERW